MTQRETASGGLPFFTFAAVRRDKKEPPGAARRAAQAGGILESFRDHHTAPRPPFLPKAVGWEYFVKVHRQALSKIKRVCYTNQKRSSQEPSFPHERSDLDEVYVCLQEDFPE